MMEQIHFLCWCHYQIQCFLLSNNWPPCVTYLTAGHCLCSPMTICLILVQWKHTLPTISASKTFSFFSYCKLQKITVSISVSYLPTRPGCLVQTNSLGSHFNLRLMWFYSSIIIIHYCVNVVPLS